MTQETQTDNIDSNSSLMKQQHNLFKTGSQFESQSERAKKRERSSDSSGLIQTEAKPSKIKRVNGQEVETDLLKLDFACPFYKWDPQKYGGKIGCAIYSSPDVDTMLRHHVHRKHRPLNKETPYIDDSRFEKLKGIKIKGLQHNKRLKDVMKYGAAYKILFQPSTSDDIEIPSPYFDPNQDIVNVGRAIDECLTDRGAKEPDRIGESAKLCREIAELKAKRDHEKCEVYKQIAAEESEIRARRERQIDAIDSRYETEISKASQRLTDFLLDEPEASTAPRTLAPRPLSWGAAGDAQASRGFEIQTLLERSSDLNESDDVRQMGSSTPNATTTPTQPFENMFQAQYHELFPDPYL